MLCPNVILVHFGELILKGRNRAFFERLLIKNIKIALTDFDFRWQKKFGKCEIWPAKVNGVTVNFMVEHLQRVSGIATLYVAKKNYSSNYAQIEDELVKELRSTKFTTFAVRAKRINKKFPLSSSEINQKLGARLLMEFGGKVDLSDPQIEIFVFVTEYGVYFSLQKFAGLGGLPVGTSGRAISLLSTGIDSPVASRLMQQRGLAVNYVHFHSYPLTSKASVDLVKDLVKVLQAQQPRVKLLLVPLADLQKQIVQKAPSAYRVVMYRRAMLELSARLGKQLRANALITGDSLGQVASQTIANITAVSAQIDLPILRPLIGLDKEKIIALAKQIGTYSLSIRPVEDCCSLLTPPRVTTATTFEMICKIKQQLPWAELIEDALQKSSEQWYN